MKVTTPTLLSYLNGLRPTSDARLLAGDLFSITLASGTALTYTDLDLPVAWNSHIFLANSILISGLRYKCSLGCNADKQQVTISARTSDTIGGAPFLQAMQQGLFDGAFVQREKAFFSSWATNGDGALTPLGTVLLFKGRVAQVDEIGRTTAKVTVASDMVLLDIDMPRNLWAPQCQHVLYDSGCGLARGTFSANGAVEAGSTTTTINWSGASSAYQQGAITFTGGVNTGIEMTIKAATSGVLTLAYPLPHAPAVGDAFTVAQGCDHTMATCQNTFNNLGNFRGFPYVPPPQVMTGPMATTRGGTQKG